MLSILIPTKDYNCCALVKNLHQQAEALGIAYEIIVGEDGSSPQGLALNSQLTELPNCRIIAMAQNVGRSHIRNILAQEARGKDIMFIDSDAMVQREDILQQHIKTLEENCVVCGGLYHPAAQPDNDCSLRYRYEKEADKHRSAAKRNETPYDKFTTFSFAIRRELFLSIKFDERIKNYGYEDTLFGYELRKRGVKIMHIDAPLMHVGLESNNHYLAKVEESLRTLAKLESTIESTTLLKCYNRLKRLHLTGLIAALWSVSTPLMRKNLLGRHPSLTMLNIYKIGYYCKIKRGL